MKALLILLIVSNPLRTVISAVDYCEVEKKLCGNRKHIGCDKNIFEDRRFQLKPMTNELKELILEKINSFRSLVATGQHPQFESSSNMRLVTWNNEMEYITSRMLNKFTHAYYICTAMETFPLSTHFTKRLVTIDKTLSVTIKQIFKNLFKDIDNNTKYSRFFAANLTKIGCNCGGFNYGYEIDLECITSIGDSTSIEEAYLPGIPCSNCSMFNQVCSKKYQGLCEDSLQDENCENKNQMFEPSDQNQSEFMDFYSSLKLKASRTRNTLTQLICNFSKLFT